MNSRIWIAALVVLLALVGAIYFYSVGGTVSDDGITSQSATTPAVTNTSSSAGAGKRESEAEPKIAAPPPRSLTLLDRYVQSTDLLELVEQLRADADAGKADAARMIAKAYDECFPYAANHKILDRASMTRFLKEPDISIALGMRTMQLKRCSGFIKTGVIKGGVVRDAETKATDLGDSTAKVVELSEGLSARRRDDSGPYDLSPSEIDFVQGVALSRDVEAIAALSYIDMETYPAYGYAWELVACDLGRDCGWNGYLMRQQCLYMGQCVAGDYRELIRRKFLAPDQFNVAQTREQEILRAIGRGDVSHLFH